MGILIAVAWIVLLIGAIYLFLIRPQRRDAVAHEALIKSLDVGDEVVLASGIVGQIMTVDEANNLFGVEIAPGVQVAVIRQAVNRRVEHSDGTTSDEIDVTRDETNE